MNYARKHWDSTDYRVGLEIAADPRLSWAEVAAEMTARGRPPRSAHAVSNTLRPAGAPLRAVANVLRKAGTPPRATATTEAEPAPLFPTPASAPAALPDAVAAFVAHVRATARAEVFAAIRAALAEIEAAS